MSNLEYLSDMIGARLTGTENLKKANDWTRQKFADYGVANPHLESWTLAHTWTRVSATGQIVSPAVHTLTIASYAWAPSTNGLVRGHVIYVKARNMDDLAQYKGKLKDAIVISAEPNLPPAPDQPAPNPVDVPYGDSFLLVTPRRPGAEPVFGPDFRKFLQARTAFFKNEGVLATLTDSGKPDGLLNMTGMGGRNYDIAAISAAFVSSASYGMIWRLLQRGPVDVELNIANSTGDKPIEVYNTVAEIRGSEKPDEIVILGAHLDSWDLGEGTTDNGTGSMVVGSRACAAKARFATETNHPLRAIFRRRARFGWLASLCCRSQGRTAEDIGRANPRYRDRASGEHQPDAKLSRPRSNGQSCSSAAFARITGIDSAIYGWKRSRFFRGSGRSRIFLFAGARAIFPDAPHASGHFRSSARSGSGGGVAGDGRVGLQCRATA
jgi:hypothetical protein